MGVNWIDLVYVVYLITPFVLLDSVVLTGDLTHLSCCFAAPISR